MKTESSGLKVQCKVHFNAAKRGRKQIVAGPAPAPTSVPLGHVPRISRLMALAIRFDDLIHRGDVSDYAELARLGHVTRARLTQIMNLLNLAPDIQEAILFLPRTPKGKDPIKEWQIRPLSAVGSWRVQRASWRALRQNQSDESDSKIVVA